MSSVTPTGVVATEVSPAPRVRVADQDGHSMEGIEVLFRFAGIAPTPTENRTVRVFTDIDGVARVDWSLGTVVGEYRATAESPGLPSVIFTAVARPGPATSMTLMNGVQRAPAGMPLGLPLSIWLRDAYSNAVPRALVTFSVTSGGGWIAGDTVLTDASGVATSGAWTLGPTLGNQYVIARAGGVTLNIPGEAYAVPPCDAACADAGVIAFVRHGNIHLADIQGSVMQLTTGGNDAQPVWSPDGRRIAFTRHGSSQPDIYVLVNDIERPIRRMTPDRGGRSPAWSPDGRHIAFAARCDGDSCIRVMSAETGAVSPVRLGNPSGYNADPSWSRDGSRIAFVSDYSAFGLVFDIYLAAADGSSITQLTDGLPAQGGLEYFLHPTWSPDGATIAFVHGRTIGESSNMRFSVAGMNTDGTNARELAWAGDIAWTELADPGSISWSPDSGRIAFTAVDCDLSVQTSCSYARSVRYVTRDGAREGPIVTNGADPSWKR